MQIMVGDRNYITCQVCDRVGNFDIMCPLRFKYQLQNDGHHS